ncbi:DUF2141 domain-containing protein [Rhodospira trueperi]|uniref:Uncharacterized conserved protein, DUF2141 family n=1 Tax=Rhodospira trueperi TaxID=69960 RepID=A0A1G7G0B2_9PROT|nr:DUF2141 domain-containing protein [Rhodospira trueperi]SDE81604.1 Uncharacterized conserved protein, DUF2141 family [Rhodospira trueperi]
MTIERRQDPRLARGLRRGSGAAALVMLALIGGSASATTIETDAPSATLSLTITDVTSDRGTVHVALYDRPDAFLDKQRMLTGAIVAAQEGKVVIQIPDLPPGRYAVAAYHDENDNGRFDLGLFGIPLEGFGFSRDPGVIPRRPTFDDAAFPVTAPESRQTFSMRYSVM